MTFISFETEVSNQAEGTHFNLIEGRSVMNKYDFNIFRKQARRAKAYLRLAKHTIKQYKTPRAEKNILSNDPRLQRI